MPIVKIDHIVSFSSEDPKHPANNLLVKDPAKKWKCQNTGEKSINVILQLDKATVINGIDIGNEHSAYIEVLVTRSSRNDDDFKPLLVMSSFMSALESRQSQNVNKVRMFTQSQLSKPECDEKWDRIKVVCTQPFNRHVQYGLSFIVIHSNEQSVVPQPQPQTTTANLTLRPESPDPFSPGKLFANWKDQQSDTPVKGATAIRLSTTPAYLAKHGPPVCKAKNITPKPSSATPNKKNSSEDKPLSRNRDSLLYDKEDEEPNDKIDKIVKRDQELKEKKKAAVDEEPSTSANKRVVKTPKNENGSEKGKRKAEDNRTPNKKVKRSNLRKPFHSLLNGVVLTISGIVNPDRGTLRTLALEMGAKYKPDWDQTCTHLICAFVNTPKFNQVKGKGKIVKKQWIEDCHKERKRLPWRRYALDRSDQKKDESEEEILEEVQESDNENPDADTDEEIERIRQKQQKQVHSDTDEEVLKPPTPPGTNTDLLDLFKDKTFFIDSSFADDIYRNIKKYIIAYGGEVVEDPTDDNIQVFITVKDNSDVLKEINSCGAFLDVSWIWDCHNEQKLIPINKYVL